MSIYATLEENMDMYSKVELSFVSYYKYQFTYVGTNGELLFKALIGDGDSNSIYKFNLESDMLLQHLPADELWVSADKGATWEKFYDE